MTKKSTSVIITTGKIRYKLKMIIKIDSFFKKEETSQWLCRKCGHVQISQCAPNICPVCKHAQGYFELFGTDFFINNDKDENLERIPVNKRKRIAKIVTNNIDKIMETLESFNVSAITYNYRTEDIETERITYANNEIIESEIEEEEVDQFMKDFDVEIAIGAWA